MFGLTPTLPDEKIGIDFHRVEREIFRFSIA